MNLIINNISSLDDSELTLIYQSTLNCIPIPSPSYIILVKAPLTADDARSADFVPATIAHIYMHSDAHEQSRTLTSYDIFTRTYM